MLSVVNIDGSEGIEVFTVPSENRMNEEHMWLDAGRVPPEPCANMFRLPFCMCVHATRVNDSTTLRPASDVPAVSR